MKNAFSRLIGATLSCTMLVSGMVFVNPVTASAASMSAGGWFNSLYANISGVKDADVTAVSYSGAMSGSLSGDDFTYLVRDDSNGVRIDIPGLKAGDYTVSVTTKSGNFSATATVLEDDRSGFAHSASSEGIGAYNNDGTLKSNARVLYVTDDNKETVTLATKDGTTSVSGIGNILNSAGGSPRMDDGVVMSTVVNTNNDIIRKIAQDGTPLDIRFVGEVTAPTGLTEYNSYDYGGTPGDNGYMARMQSGKDVTLEGIGSDAMIKGWGVHFIAQTSYPEYGKSFEVKNLTFWGSPEDSVGVEGQQESNKITAAVERIWVHNNSFLPQKIANPAESDKAEGDGCCDFKRGQYMTMSYNYFYKAHKTSLWGSSDSSLQYHVTWHHNMWEECESRGPLGRQADGHLYNNYYLKQSSYAMNTRANAYIFAEANTMEYCKNPMVVVTGAIKSYNNTLLGCSGTMDGTVVTDKSTKVATSNTYANFDTDSQFYVAKGDYKLQTAAESKKTILAYAGVMKASVISEDEVESSLISAENIPTASVVLPYTGVYQKTGGKNSPTAKGSAEIANVIFNTTKVGTTNITIRGEGIVFNVAQRAKITMEGAVSTGAPVLYDMDGNTIIDTSGTAIVEAGTYFIQSNYFDVGTGVFKEAVISSLSIDAADPNETVETTTITKPATTEATTEATTASKDDGDDGDDSEETEPTTSAPYDGTGLVWDYTSDTNTLKATVDANDWSNAAAVSYNGSTFTEAIKMESGTSIVFNAPSDGNLTVVSYSSNAKPAIKVNGESVTISTNGSTVIPVSAGTVTITKDTASTYLYLLEFIGESTTTESTTEATTSSTNENTTEATTSTPVDGVSVSLTGASVVNGEEVSVPVKVSGITVGSYRAEVGYDATKLEYVSTTAGSSDNGIELVVNDDFTEKGVLTIAGINSNGVSTDVLFELKFKAKEAGDSTVTVFFDELADTDDKDTTPGAASATITVTEVAKTPGDVDENGYVNNKDAALLLKYITGIATLTETGLANAECDGKDSGKPDMLDVIWIIAHESKEVLEDSGLTALSAESYNPSSILNSSSNFIVENNKATKSNQIKIDETGYIEFKVDDGATVTITYKCGSSDSAKHAAVVLDGNVSEYAAGGSSSTKTFTVSNLAAGTYRIYAKQDSDTSAQITEINVAY